MRHRSALYSLLALGLSAFLAGCAGAPAAKPAPVPAASTSGASPAAKAALDGAEKALTEVKKVGHEWRLIDRATGPDSETLTKLLEVAKGLASKGQDDEAIRVAKRVQEAAMLGLQQAADNANAGPVFPK